MRFAVVMIFGCGLMACASDEAPAHDPAAEGVAALVVTEDDELREIAGRLLPGLAERSGLEVRDSIRLARRSRAELERFLEAKLDEEIDEARAEGLAEAYALLGLVPEDFDLRATLLEVYTEQVAGFYDPDSTTLYVLDDQPGRAIEELLLHELVHAVQDQWVDLAAVTAPTLDNDRRAAAQAAIEGHATLVMLEYVMRGMSTHDLDLLEVPDFARQMRPALEGIGSEYPALGGAPRIIRESLLLPYLHGASYVQSVWRTRGSRVPLGEILPASTEQVADPDRFTRADPDLPTGVQLTLAPPARIELDDVLGHAEVRILLGEIVGPEAGAGAEGWDGDRWALVAEGATRGLVWAAVFDDAAARDRFVGLLAPRLDAFPRRATLDASTVEGRPIVLLRVGIESEVTVTLGGDG
ncbi:MAG: hypothetical protein RQ745_12280 [Longimicrobiales bacterium]|nr:hypothetical protein [Longimicrobiales bacterium]